MSHRGGARRSCSRRSAHGQLRAPSARNDDPLCGRTRQRGDAVRGRRGGLRWRGAASVRAARARGSPSRRACKGSCATAASQPSHPLALRPETRLTSRPSSSDVDPPPRPPNRGSCSRSTDLPARRIMPQGRASRCGRRSPPDCSQRGQRPARNTVLFGIGRCSSALAARWEGFGIAPGSAHPNCFTYAQHAEIALYHGLGNLPEPDWLTHKFTG